MQRGRCSIASTCVIQVNQRNACVCSRLLGAVKAWEMGRPGRAVNPGIRSATCSEPFFNQALADPTDGKPVPRANPSYCGIYWIRPWEQSQPDGQPVTLIWPCAAAREMLWAPGRAGESLAPCGVQSAAKYRLFCVSHEATCNPARALTPARFDWFCLNVPLLSINLFVPVVIISPHDAFSNVSLPLENWSCSL